MEVYLNASFVFLTPILFFFQRRKKSPFKNFFLNLLIFASHWYVTDSIIIQFKIRPSDSIGIFFFWLSAVVGIVGSIKKIIT